MFYLEITNEVERLTNTYLDEDYRKNETNEVIKNKILEVVKYFQM